MEIELLLHAERQLKERNIGLKEVKESLKKPDQIVEGSSAGRKVAQKIFKKGGKKFLYRVVFKKENAKCLVITVYRTTKIEKYLKEVGS